MQQHTLAAPKHWKVGSRHSRYSHYLQRRCTCTLKPCISAESLKPIMEIGVASLALDGDDHDTFPLLNELLEDLPEVLERFVLPALDPTALALLARAGKKWRAAVPSSGMPCAGTFEGVPLRVREFCGSVDCLVCAKCAKANGCPWNDRTCALAAHCGQVEVLMWARKHDYPWDTRACTHAAWGGHLDMLRWVREHGCPWDDICRSGRTTGGIAVGAGAPLPVGREHM